MGSTVGSTSVKLYTDCTSCFSISYLAKGSPEKIGASVGKRYLPEAPKSGLRQVRDKYGGATSLLCAVNYTSYMYAGKTPSFTTLRPSHAGTVSVVRPPTHHDSPWCSLASCMTLCSFLGAEVLINEKIKRMILDRAETVAHAIKSGFPLFARAAWRA